jgi:hypothetical protein
MWSRVTIAGIASGGGAVLVMIRHAGIEQGEVAEALRRRWPGLSVSDLGITPTWAMPVEDVVELALARRGLEPLRVVIFPQRRPRLVSADRRSGTSAVEMEPMPWLL